MKFLNAIDLWIQAILFAIFITLAIAMVVGGEVESIATLAWAIAALLGPWQLASSLLTTAMLGHFLSWRRIHLFTSIGYLTLMLIFGSHIKFGEVVNFIVGAFIYATPATLAVFYFYITIKTFRARHEEKPVAR